MRRRDTLRVSAESFASRSFAVEAVVTQRTKDVRAATEVGTAPGFLESYYVMRVVILGAGFGGLELATILSSADEGGFDVVLIDKENAFVFGYSKLDVMFGRTTLDAVRLPYSAFAKPGVRLLRETVTAIDPEARRVKTDAGAHEADVLVVALGAD